VPGIYAFVAWAAASSFERDCACKGAAVKVATQRSGNIFVAFMDKSFTLYIVCLYSTKVKLKTIATNFKNERIIRINII
jgi:hypothetical protein